MVFWKMGWIGRKLVRLNYYGVDEVFFLLCDLLLVLLWELIVIVIVCGGNLVGGKGTETLMWRLRVNGIKGRI